MQEELNKELHQLEEEASHYNFVLVKTPYGLFLGPGTLGKPLSPEEIEKLSEEQRDELHQIQEKLSGSIEKTLAHLREQSKLLMKSLKI